MPPLEHAYCANLALPSLPCATQHTLDGLDLKITLQTLLHVFCRSQTHLCPSPPLPSPLPLSISHFAHFLYQYRPSTLCSRRHHAQLLHISSQHVQRVLSSTEPPAPFLQRHGKLHLSLFQLRRQQRACHVSLLCPTFLGKHAVYSHSLPPRHLALPPCFQEALQEKTRGFMGHHQRPQLPPGPLVRSPAATLGPPHPFILHPCSPLQNPSHKMGRNLPPGEIYLSTMEQKRPRREWHLRNPASSSTRSPLTSPLISTQSSQKARYCIPRHGACKNERVARMPVHKGIHTQIHVVPPQTRRGHLPCAAWMVLRTHPSPWVMEKRGFSQTVYTCPSSSAPHARCPQFLQ
jgi:hypothetical protein